MTIKLDNTSTFSWHTYYAFFMRVWRECIKEGWGAKDARDYAQLEWEAYVIKHKLTVQGQPASNMDASTDIQTA